MVLPNENNFYASFDFLSYVKEPLKQQLIRHCWFCKLKQKLFFLLSSVDIDQRIFTIHHLKKLLFKNVSQKLTKKWFQP